MRCAALAAKYEEKAKLVAGKLRRGRDGEKAYKDRLEHFQDLQVTLHRWGYFITSEVCR